MNQDVLVFGLLLLAILVAGFISRLKAASIAERFAAKRQLSWLTLGASMAAAQISADTPLLVSGAVYADGLAGNWFWWIGAPGVLATLFFFAPLWRRSGVLTDIEIVRLRYGDGGLARAYRITKAIADGLIVNALVLASNLLAFTLLLDALLNHRSSTGGIPLATIVATTFLVVTGLFVVMAGFRGLVRANTVELVFAILSAGILAWFAVAGLPHGLDTLRSLKAAHSDVLTLNVLPKDNSLGLVVLVGFGWWQEASGRSMLVQRMVASRDEREAGLTVMSFSVLHYLLRPWGWYLVGAASVFYWPHLGQPEQALPKTAEALLPNYLFALLVASVALSFMGCVNSRLNLGASYLVNDVAKVLSPRMSNRHARWVEVGTTGVLGLSAFFITASHTLSSIRGLYQFLLMMMAGTGFVSIVRWYWSGTTLLGELASYVSALVVAGLALAFVDIQKPTNFAMMSGLNFSIGAAVTILVAKTWPRQSAEVLRTFHDRVQPGGPGWTGFGKESPLELRRAAIKWGSANIVLFSTIFLIVSLIAGRYLTALILAGITVAVGCLLIGPIIHPSEELKES